MDSSSNDSSEKEDFWENGKEDGSLIALQSIFDSIEDVEVPIHDISIKHRHTALLRVAFFISYRLWAIENEIMEVNSRLKVC